MLSLHKIHSVQRCLIILIASVAVAVHDAEFWKRQDKLSDFQLHVITELNTLHLCLQNIANTNENTPNILKCTKSLKNISDYSAGNSPKKWILLKGVLNKIQYQKPKKPPSTTPFVEPIKQVGEKAKSFKDELKKLREAHAKLDTLTPSNTDIEAWEKTYQDLMDEANDWAKHKFVNLLEVIMGREPGEEEFKNRKETMLNQINGWVVKNVEGILSKEFREIMEKIKEFQNDGGQSSAETSNVSHSSKLDTFKIIVPLIRQLALKLPTNVKDAGTIKICLEKGSELEDVIKDLAKYVLPGDHNNKEEIHDNLTKLSVIIEEINNNTPNATS